MIKKKNEKSNIENKRVLYFEMGLSVALAFLLVAFEWGTTDMLVSEHTFDISDEFTPEIQMKITKPEPPKPAPPMMPIEIIVIKDIEENIDEPDFIWTTDIPFDGIVDFYDFPEEISEVIDEPFIKVEKMPTYQGNSTVYFQRHLQQLVKYPKIAQEEGIYGKVFVEFVVDEKGNIIREKIIKSPHPSLSDAVLLAMKKTERWQPGQQRGRKVKVSFTVPVSFKLSL